MEAVQSAAMGLISTVLKLEEPSLSAKMLLIVLHCHTDSEDKTWLSDYEISRLMGMHEKSIQKLLRELLNRKLILRVYDGSRHRYIVPLAYKWETPLDPTTVEV